MEGFEVVKRSQIDGDFEGFDDDAVFKLMDGTYWLQDEYKYWYHYEYCPRVNILSAHGRLYINVDGTEQLVSIRQITDVIESRINGEFTGWEGETSYELLNGQVWQQLRYKYEYKYAYQPEVVIFNPGGGHIMHVAGTSAHVHRVN